MVYNGTSHENWWFRGTPILGNLHIFLVFGHARGVIRRVATLGRQLWRPQRVKCTLYQNPPQKTGLALKLLSAACNFQCVSSNLNVCQPPAINSTISLISCSPLSTHKRSERSQAFAVLGVIEKRLPLQHINMELLRKDLHDGGFHQWYQHGIVKKGSSRWRFP